MSQNTSSGKSLCAVHKTLPDSAAGWVRHGVCKDLSASFDYDGKTYCVLHLPDENKIVSTNFSDIIESRLRN